MKNFLAAILTSLLLVMSLSAAAAPGPMTSIEEYNRAIPFWGVSWAPGANAVNGYYPSFYTGFAMRSQSPERIHIRLSRGNQVRVSVILDPTTVNDYMFDLVKRNAFYKKMANRTLNLSPAKAVLLPQLSYYSAIVESPKYGISSAVAQSKSGGLSGEALYAKGLATLKALNPGRVFSLRIDLKKEFAKWKTDMQQPGVASGINSNPKAVVEAINSLVFGRINYTDKPTAEVMAKLLTAVSAAANNASEAEFIAAAFDLFKTTTGSKYAIKVLNSQGQFEDALKCSAANCTLTYPEFTAIYPIGSAQAYTKDEFGNKINDFTTPGLWNFLAYGGGRDVDNIRNEPFYGWAPKMDYQNIGNGFHNPAVRFFSPPSSLKQMLGISPSHNSLWAVKRGGVSHGCSRVPTGHIWEMRQILPVENQDMTKVFYFGHNSNDFDLYDIDGDGQLEVMGVQYYISYGLQGADSTGQREGTGFEVNGNKKLDFYTDLYGARNVFSVSGTKFLFLNPGVSLPSYLDKSRAGVQTRIKMEGQYPLYEAAYEQEKIQFYALPGMNKQVIRLMGRVRGCAPSTDKKACGEAAFDNEVKQIIR